MVVQTANRFMKFLHQQKPDIYKQVELHPISSSVLETYNAKLEKKVVGRFINDEDWAIMKKQLPKEIRSACILMYDYGLRRAESLGFTKNEAVRKQYLNLTHQLLAMTPQPTYGPLKSRDARMTPHWFCTPNEAYKLVLDTLEHKMHPDSFSEKFDYFMKDMIEGGHLTEAYHLHDFRRTFITRALRTQAPRDVQLAVGHVDLRTTMGYAQDDRELEDDVFVPTRAG